MSKRLLFVEDEPSLARAVSRLLRRAGYDVLVAGSATEARAATGAFSLGVFDLDLPDGDGVELASELFDRHVVRRVVFFSGTPDEKRRLRATTIGPFIDKALGTDSLLRAVELLLSTEHVKVSGAGDVRLGESSSPPPSGVTPKKRGR